MCALFSAVTVAYQCYFAGWAAQYFLVGPNLSSETLAPGALNTIAATGTPIAFIVIGLLLALRGNAFWRTAGTAVTLLTALVVLLPGGVDLTPINERVPITPMIESLPLAFAFPTLCAGFFLTPYFDLTFHRAAQQAPSPRIAFATFGLTFAAMLLLIASFYDPSTGAPRIGPALLVLWGVQLAFTIAVHLRELITRAGRACGASGYACLHLHARPCTCAGTPALVRPCRHHASPGRARLSGILRRVWAAFPGTFHT